VITCGAQIERDLEQWGEWSRRYSDGMGFPTMTGFRRLAGAPLDWDYDISFVPIIFNISEDYALKLDRIIADMKNKQGGLECKTALEGIYVMHMPKAKLCKAMRVNTVKLNQILDNAKLYVSLKI